MSHLFRTKSIDALIAASEEPGKRLEKTLGPWSLTALGIGAVIGSGIFILTGTAAAGEKLTYDSILHAPVLDLLLHGRAAVSTMGRPGAGPAISLSFLLTALAWGLAEGLEWPVWSGFAIVAVLTLLLAAVLAAAGRARLGSEKRMPLTVETLKENMEWMRARTS